jgi:hypothetical protein
MHPCPRPPFGLTAPDDGGSLSVLRRSFREETGTAISQALQSDLGYTPLPQGPPSPSVTYFVQDSPHGVCAGLCSAFVPRSTFLFRLEICLCRMCYSGRRLEPSSIADYCWVQTLSYSYGWYATSSPYHSVGFGSLLGLRRRQQQYPASSSSNCCYYIPHECHRAGGHHPAVRGICFTRPA